jgi:3-oxoacyl-[acyl-carrier-protein] synthase-3
MIFGDGAAAIVVAPGETSDVELLQTYASGPVSEVNSIIWPNPEFDNDITVYGPEVKSLVQRYLDQMLAELGDEPDPDQPSRPMIDSIDLIVPHQANKTMILGLAEKAGLTPDQLYFDIETMGNVSAASIPIAIADAVRDGAITSPVRVFAPGFGAGAVGGYAVLRVDPAIVAPERATPAAHATRAPAVPTTSDDVRVAFGE